jgi:response regulator RpfG family c-di-GMP phosphodiesterase
MPLSTIANFMESLDTLSLKISHLKDETSIAVEAVAVIAKTLPASGYAIVQLAEHNRHASILHGTGEWRDCTGIRVGIPELFLKKGEFFQATLPVEMPPVSLDAERNFFYVIPLSAQQSVWGYAFLLFPQEPTASERNFLRTAFSWTAKAIVGASLRRRVDQFQRQMDMLTAVEHAVNSSLSISVTQNVLLDACLHVLEADAAALWVMDPLEGALLLSAKRGFNRTYPLDRHMHATDSLAQRAIGERRLITQVTPQDEKNAERMMRVEKFRYGVAAPLLARGECKGVLEVYSRSEEEPLREWMTLYEKMVTQATIAVDHALMIGALERASIHLSVTCDSAIEALSRAVDLRTREADGHSHRVADLTIQMAELARIPAHQMMHIHRGALLHDIGKIGVPDAVLWKPGAYTDGDWQWMHRHPQFAFDILQSLEVLQPAMGIPQYHHERWDGKGYPHGLTGNQIPLAARLFAVVDCWDSMLAPRPHRQPIGKSEAILYIQQGAGNQFDPEAVRIFLNLNTDSKEHHRF